MATPKPTVLTFGNRNPQWAEDIREEQPDGGVLLRTIRRPAPHMSQSVTTVALDPHATDEEHVKLATSTNNDRELSRIHRGLKPKDKRHTIAIQQMERIVEQEAGGEAPAWIRCDDDKDLERVLAENFDCAQGEPVALMPTTGRDYLTNQALTTTFMALSASAHTPASADTAMTAEITTAGGGLIRGSVTYAHTSGTNTSTLVRTFTANGSDSLAVTITQMGVLSASSGGTLIYYTNLSSSATLSVSGDNVTVTDTATIG